MLFGIEVEFASKKDLGIVSLDRLNFSFSVPFTISHDTSCGIQGTDYKGYEFKNGWPTENPLYKMKEALEYLKKFEPITHKTCGLHIHFSGMELSAAQITAFEKLAINMRWKAREEWCRNKLTGARYNFLRFIDNKHYEFRAFNSTLCFRGIAKNFESVKKILESGVS